MTTKINSLETLRGFAALVVALYHFPSTSPLYIEKGNLAVYFFFSLSGFVISLNYFDKINSFKDVLKFQIKRFYRLYPIHILVLLIILSIQLLKFFLLNFFEIESGSDAFEPDKVYSLSEFFRHLLLLQAVYKDGYFLSWNGAAWTISTEFYTYFLFGLLTLITQNNKFFFILITFLFIYFFDIATIYLSEFLNPIFFECIKYFFTGCISYFIFQVIKHRINDFTFILIIISFLFFEKKFFFLDSNISFCLIILLVSILKTESQISKLLNLKPLVYFGSISYSFYMIHQSILYIYIQILKLVFKVKFVYYGNVATNTGNVYFDTFIMLTYIFLATIVASFMYKYVETKFRK
jgi:peptidoglycan/LPS O-acetylase OafA/YrhL